MISLKFAQQLQDAFGPCTGTYECRTAEDTLLEITREYHGDVSYWARIGMDVHSIQCERGRAWMEYADPDTDCAHSRWNILKRLELLNIDCAAIRKDDDLILRMVAEDKAKPKEETCEWWG